MTISNQSEQPGQRINSRIIVGFVALPILFALLLFLPAGSWIWARGWVFILVLLIKIPVVVFYLWRVNPEVVIARSRIHKGTKFWDRNLLSIYFPAMLAILPVAALDDGRYHWFPVPWWVCGIGYVFLLAGIGIVTWAEAVNKFFEVTVRIQTDRGQTVIDSGPYAIVRHPGYVGAIFTAVGMALSLGSLWALIPAGIASAVLILRTLWEDQMLQAELAGYQEYTKRVCYKLIPGVW